MNPKILIVDDEPDIVRLLQMKLQRSGYEVVLLIAVLMLFSRQKRNADAVLMDR
jgi:DNA-binding response OmpR family regulator